jgi:transposase
MCDTPAPRYQRPDRAQITLRPVDLDQLLTPDSPARAVWDFVEGLDLSALYDAIRAVEGAAGRPPIDPRILVALWLFATIEGIGSARELARACTRDIAFQWICGGVPVNYHTLSDFRVGHTAFLDGLLTGSVALLMKQNLVDLNRVAHDGMRVRASAGAASFRRRQTLEECRKTAGEQIERLKREIEDDPRAASDREKAARLRAAEERRKRVEEALRQLPELESKKEKAQKVNPRKPASQAEARASTTDPDARVMKMADGGFRPAFNVQFASDAGSQVVVGVDVHNSGSDGGKMLPMVEQLHRRYGRAAEELLVDGGFATIEGIKRVSAPPFGCTVFAPVHKARKAGVDPHSPRPGDSPTIRAWRARMATEVAKRIYKWRAATAECVNAKARRCGLSQLVVRGIEKVRAVALWFAIAHNLTRAATLRPIVVRA